MKARNSLAELAFQVFSERFRRDSGQSAVLSDDAPQDGRVDLPPHEKILNMSELGERIQLNAKSSGCIPQARRASSCAISGAEFNLWTSKSARKALADEFRLAHARRLDERSAHDASNEFRA